MAMNAYRNLTTSENQLSKSLERLSSGYRINRAADDAAGLVISEGLRSQVMGLKMATRNAQDGVSVVQTAEGALTETHSILQRIRELAVQAASTGSSDQPSRDAAQTEVVQLKAELDRIASTTQFGAQTLLDGSYGSSNQLAGTVAAYATTTITAGTDDTFDLQFKNSAGVNQAVTVTLNAGAYTTADSLAAEFTRGINAAIQTVDPSSVGSISVTAQVQSNGTGVKFVMTGKAAFGVDDANGAGGVEDAGDDVNGAFTHLRIGVAAGDGGASFAPASTTDTYSSVVGTGGVFQVGSGTAVNDKITINIGDMSSGATGLNLGLVDVSVAANVTSNLTSIDAAITKVSTLRGNLGAYQNRFEHTIANLSVTTENLSASESRIRDTDMAAEMMSFTRAQILQQAGTAMLAQANAVPQSVLQLLK
jgi:flagellin